MPGPAVIFDMDGVLVDSYRAHFQSWARLYEEIGRPYSEAEFAADFGRTSRDILRRAFGPAISDERIRQLNDRKESLFRDILRASFRPMDGAIALIDALSADGFLLAIGSSGPPENIELALDKLGRAASFGAVVTGADLSRGKPDPQVFLVAAERLGVPPASCAVVEDAVHGIEAANCAGMASVGLTGTNPRQRLSEAMFVVDRLAELTPQLLRNLIARRDQQPAV